MNLRRSHGLLLGLLAVAATVRADPPGVYLGDLAWPEAEARMREAPLVILPFAAGAKEHGPHLPLATDAIVMDYLLAQAVANAPVVVAPPVLHGWMPAFRDFPGTNIADPVAFQDYMLALSRSLVKQGAQRLVYLNTGISKASGLPLAVVAREIRVQDGVPTLLVSWDDLETDAVAALAEQREGGHADEIETSIMLFLAPQRVDMARARADYASGRSADHAGYQPGLFSREPSDPAYSETGLYGDPTLATAAKGDAALALMTAEWLKALAEFGAVPLVRER